MWSVGSVDRCDFCGRAETMGARRGMRSVCVGCVTLASEVVMFAEEQREEDDTPPPTTLSCTFCDTSGVRHLVESDVEVAGATARLCDSCIGAASSALEAINTKILVPGSEDAQVAPLDPPSGVMRIRT